MVQKPLQLVIEPFNRKSRLLAPTEIPVAPLGISHCCDTTSQMEKSYRERLNVTVVDCPAARNTLSNPFRLNGADLAEAGGEV